MYLLSGALACTSMLVIFQSVLLYRNRRQPRGNKHILNKVLTVVLSVRFMALKTVLSLSDSQSGLARSSVQTTDTDDIHYAALSVSLPNRTKRQRDNTCVYASVKHN